MCGREKRYSFKYCKKLFKSGSINVKDEEIDFLVVHFEGMFECSMFIGKVKGDDKGYTFRIIPSLLFTSFSSPLTRVLLFLTKRGMKFVLILISWCADLLPDCFMLFLGLNGIWKYCLRSLRAL